MIEGASLAAAELMHAEVLSVLRWAVLKGYLQEARAQSWGMSAGVSPVGYLQEARAQMVIDDLSHWPVGRISHRSLVTWAWRYHRNVSAYDAFYVAATRVHGLPLMTADGRLSRASGLGVVVQHVRMGGRGPLACGGSMDYTGPGLR